MSVYIVAQHRVDDPDKLNEYVRQVIPTIQEHGGKVLAVDESPEMIEGTVDFPRTVILEFPDNKTFRLWYNSATYQMLLPTRFAATEGTLIVARGL
tara:strand:- start:341 stop:628 length:288 start_codon:yes stop_codon:yes gene_type:complete